MQLLVFLNSSKSLMMNRAASFWVWWPYRLLSHGVRGKQIWYHSGYTHNKKL
jgi:hypothetical protein